MFVALGHNPRSALVAGQVDTDSEGYVVVDAPSTRTSLPGVFAARDIVDRTYRQAGERWLAEVAPAADRTAAGAMS
jgi:thioredoxin reductase (NADPH)